MSMMTTTTTPRRVMTGRDALWTQHGRRGEGPWREVTGGVTWDDGKWRIGHSVLAARFDGLPGGSQLGESGVGTWRVGTGNARAYLTSGDGWERGTQGLRWRVVTGKGGTGSNEATTPASSQWQALFSQVWVPMHTAWTYTSMSPFVFVWIGHITLVCVPHSH